MAKTKASPDDLLSTADAAAELNCSVARVNILIHEGRLKAIRVGWAWIVRREDLDPVRNRPTGRPRKKPAEKKKP